MLRICAVLLGPVSDSSPLGSKARLFAAEAIVQLLNIEVTINKVYSITSKEGEGPGQDPKMWKHLLESV